MGYIYALFTIFLWSMNIVASNYFATAIPAAQLTMGRWLVAAIILFALTYRQLFKKRHIIKQHLPLIFILGATGIILTNFLIYTAGETASAMNMGLLSMCTPIFLILFSRIFYKVSVSRNQIFGILLAIYGVVAIIVNGDFSQLTKLHFAIGDLYMLLMAICLATYSLLQKKKPAQLTQLEMLSSTAIAGVILFSPVVYFTSPPNFVTSLQPLDWGVFIYLGIFNSIIAYLSWNSALSKIGDIKAGVIYYLMPVFAGIGSYFVLGNPIHSAQLWGGAFILCGIALTNLPNHKLHKIKATS